MSIRLGAFVAAIVLLLPLAAAGQSEHATHHEGTAAADAQAAMTDGVIKKVDKAAGRITIAHEPLANLGMGKMTMTYPVKDRAWLDELKEGTKIRFLAENVNGTLTVVALEPVK